MYVIIGICVGVLFYHFICKPVEARKARDWCINHGLTPKEESTKRS